MYKYRKYLCIYLFGLMATLGIGPVAWAQVPFPTEYRLAGSDSLALHKIAEVPEGGYICSGIRYLNRQLAQCNPVLLRLDRNGQVKWCKAYDNPDRYGVFSLALTANGFALAYSPYINTRGYDSLTLLRTDTAGNVLLAKRYSGYTLRGFTLEQEADGFLCGLSFYYPASTYNTLSEVWKLDSNFQLIWRSGLAYATLQGQAYSPPVEKLQRQPDGSIMMLRSDWYEALLSRLTTTGQLQWTIRTGSSGAAGTSHVGSTFIQLQSGGFLISLDWRGDQNQIGTLLICTDSTGGFLWRNTTPYYYLDGMAQLADGSLLVTTGPKYYHLNLQGQLLWSGTTGESNRYNGHFIAQSGGGFVHLGSRSLRFLQPSGQQLCLDTITSSLFLLNFTYHHTAGPQEQPYLTPLHQTRLITLASQPVAVTAAQKNCIAPGQLVAAGSAQICPSDSVFLSTTAAPGMSYEWYLNNFVLPGANTSFLYARQPGWYKVITTSATGQSDTTNYLRVMHLPAPATPIVTYQSNTLSSTPAAAYQWYRNDTLLAGATQSTYVPNRSGLYHVQVKGGTCWTASAPVQVWLILTAAAGAEPGRLRLVPNPAQTYVRLYCEAQPLSTSWQLRNALGQVVRTGTTAELPLHHLPKGLYLVEARQQRLRLVIE